MSELSQDVIAKITEAAVDALATMFPDNPGLVEIATQLIPPLLDFAVAEGPAAAQELLDGLAGGKSYDHWQRLIEAASPPSRIEIMETARQAAISDTLRKVQREKRTWELLKAILQIALVSLAVL